MSRHIPKYKDEKIDTNIVKRIYVISSFPFGFCPLDQSDAIPATFLPIKERSSRYVVITGVS